MRSTDTTSAGRKSRGKLERSTGGRIAGQKQADVGLSAAKDAVRMARIAKFYEQLPKGAAPPIKATGPIQWYQNKYFGKNASAAPVWHIIFGVMTVGYSLEYYFHLRHHKNNAH
ncbi:hypothetical protein DV737_g4724, partial [Chaetothyriales sp. CBS 132003]